MTLKFGLKTLHRYESTHGLRLPFRSCGVNAMAVFSSSRGGAAHGAVQDMRWYLTPANTSTLGCLCEHMTSGSGPSALQDPQSLAAMRTHCQDGSEEQQWPARSLRGDVTASTSQPGSGGDEVLKAELQSHLEHLLSPVCLPQLPWPTLSLATAAFACLGVTNLRFRHCCARL